MTSSPKSKTSCSTRTMGRRTSSRPRPGWRTTQTSKRASSVAPPTTTPLTKTPPRADDALRIPSHGQYTGPRPPQRAGPGCVCGDVQNPFASAATAGTPPAPVIDWGHPHDRSLGAVPQSRHAHCIRSPMPTAEELDRIEESTLREIGSVKWSLGENKTGAFIAEMDFGMAPPVREALHQAVEAGLSGYLPSWLVGQMQRAYTGWAEQHYGWQLDPVQVRPIADVLQALAATIELLTPPGAAVVLPTPAYTPFLTLPGAHGRRIIQVPMIPGEAGYRYDLQALDAAFADGGGLL